MSDFAKRLAILGVPSTLDVKVVGDIFKSQNIEVGPIQKGIFDSFFVYLQL